MMGARSIVVTALTAAKSGVFQLIFRRLSRCKPAVFVSRPAAPQRSYKAYGQSLVETKPCQHLRELKVLEPKVLGQQLFQALVLDLESCKFIPRN